MLVVVTTVYFDNIFYDFASRLSNLKVFYISEGIKCNIYKCRYNLNFIRLSKEEPIY